MREETPDIDLLYRFSRGACTADERAIVEAWLSGDERRQRVLAAIAALANDPDQLDARYDVARATRRLRRAMQGALTGAKPRPVTAPVWRRPIAAMAATVLVALGLGLAARQLDRHRLAGEVASTTMASITAPHGTVQNILLPDGTRVTLAPASVITYPRAFDRGAREVHLDGEAHFAVAHDPTRRFSVVARNGVAEVVGTVFTVRAYAQDAEVRVVVAEGKVAVRAQRQASANRTTGSTLGPGDAWWLARDGRTRVDQMDVGRSTAWTRGVLAFDGAPLSEVRADLLRWMNVRLEFADPSLASRRLTGSFESASVVEFLAAIGPALSVQYTRDGNRVLLSPMPARARRLTPDSAR